VNTSLTPAALLPVEHCAVALSVCG
jgi:hypothetical protein